MPRDFHEARLLSLWEFVYECRDEIVPLHLDDLDLGPNRRLELVGARRGEIRRKLAAVDSEHRKRGALVEPEQDEPTVGVREGGDGLDDRLRQATSRSLDLDGREIGPDASQRPRQPHPHWWHRDQARSSPPHPTCLIVSIKLYVGLPDAWELALATGDAKRRRRSTGQGRSLLARASDSDQASLLNLTAASRAGRVLRASGSTTRERPPGRRFSPHERGAVPPSSTVAVSNRLSSGREQRGHQLLPE